MQGLYFARVIFKRLGVAVAATIIFPILVYGAAFACGLCAVFGVMLLAPVSAVIVGAFIFSMIRPCRERLSALGLPRTAGLIVPGLLLADWQFLSGLVWFAAFQYRISIFGFSVPIFVVLALSALVAMTVLRILRADEDALSRQHGIIGQLAVTGTAIAAMVGALSAVPIILDYPMSLLGVRFGGWHLLAAIAARNFAALIACVTLLPMAWIIFSELHAPSDGPDVRRDETSANLHGRQGGEGRRVVFGQRKHLPPRT